LQHPAVRTGAIVTVVQPGLLVWPDSPGDIDSEGAAFLIIAASTEPEVRDVAQMWLTAATLTAPTRLLVVGSLADDNDQQAVEQAVAEARTGVRIMVVGGQHDVLLTLAAARAAGALPQELTAFVTHTRDLPMYCAHCRDTHRVVGQPGEVVECPGCRTQVEIHLHHSAVRGSFLASSAEARTLA
jgi:dimethylamine monooxygenase subunit A